MAKGDRKLGLALFWASAGVCALVALIAAPELPTWSINALSILGGCCFTLTAAMLGWFKAPHPLGWVLRATLVLCLIWAGMYWPWSKVSRRPSRNESVASSLVLTPPKITSDQRKDAATSAQTPDVINKPKEADLPQVKPISPPLATKPRAQVAIAPAPVKVKNEAEQRLGVAGNTAIQAPLQLIYGDRPLNRQIIPVHVINTPKAKNFSQINFSVYVKNNSNVPVGRIHAVLSLSDRGVYQVSWPRVVDDDPSFLTAFGVSTDDRIDPKEIITLPGFTGLKSWNHSGQTIKARLKCFYGGENPVTADFVFQRLESESLE